jgi:hypothetical protein
MLSVTGKRADGSSAKEPMVDPSKSRWSIPKAYSLAFGFQALQKHYLKH